MKVGDKVVCVNDNNLYQIPVRSICEGIIYTLTEVFTCKCGSIYVRLKEVNKELKMWCPKCDILEDQIMYFHIERFRPLEHTENTEKEHISIKESILN